MRYYVFSMLFFFTRDGLEKTPEKTNIVWLKNAKEYVHEVTCKHQLLYSQERAHLDMCNEKHVSQLLLLLLYGPEKQDDEFNQDCSTSYTERWMDEG